MTVTEIIELLEDAMNKRLEEFVKLGRAAKQLLGKKKLKPFESECLVNIRIAMAQIVIDLVPVKGMVLEQNPGYKDLFDELTSFYDGYIQQNEARTSQSSVFQEDNNHTKQ